MTDQEALAIYKNHNGIRRPCDCETCKLARQILKAMDAKRDEPVGYFMGEDGSGLVPDPLDRTYYPEDYFKDGKRRW
ncbi:MAG: hypothetical protein WC455_18805 [Dehalococcoidia bacterium]|jgi:hypothetical protein